MTIWNVRVTVVELVDADSGDAAIGELHARLAAAGFEPCTDDPDAFDAFESEPLS